VQWVRALQPRTVLAIGFVAFVLYAYPGYMSTDSVGQLTEARTGVFSDGNPPFMSAEWYVLDRIVAGPLLMLLFQGALFLGGLFALWRRIVEPRKAAWIAIAILLFPPVLTPMAVIWKDSQMAAYLVAGIAAMLDSRRRVRVIGLALLVIACALRHNALAAVGPLVLMLFEWTPGGRLWKRLAVVAGALVVAIGIVFAVGRVLTTNHIRLTPMFNDIVGVISFSDEMSDDEVRAALPGVPLAISSQFQPQTRILTEMRHGYLVMNGPERFFDAPKTDADWQAYAVAWKKLVLAHPREYLAYHWDNFLYLLGAQGESTVGPVWNQFLESPKQTNGINHAASPSWVQTMLGFHAFYWLADNTPLFRPYVYALVALLLLVLCCRDRLTFALFTSGLLYELSFFPIAAEADYRYSHWMITTVVIAAAILFVKRRRPA
jgi:hypothetical protein